MMMTFGGLAGGVGRSAWTRATAAAGGARRSPPREPRYGEGGMSARPEVEGCTVVITCIVLLYIMN